MPSVLSRFTPRGIDEFTRWIGRGAPGEVPRDLLEGSDFVVQLALEPQMPRKTFADRYEFGVMLVELLNGYDQQQISFDRGLWSWLAAYYFEQLCPRDHEGKRALRKDYVYVLSQSRIYYRHLVRTPWYLVKTHGERCRYLLASQPSDPAPLGRQSSLLEELAARQFVISSPALVGAAARLYSDPRTGRPMRGAGAKGGGSPRRLALIANQLALTYDIHNMPPDRLLQLLPEEFGTRWRAAAE
ncbi:MAG: hypothetical protein AB7K64_09395 [Variibacter sp.]